MMSQTRNAISGADILVNELVAHGVETIFAITGAGNLAIIDAIARDGRISLIYSHHEQAAVMEAQGYSRVTNGLGVALVTTGGGTSNVVTGMLSAYLDSIPVLLISGNESSFHCANPHQLRAYGVQGFDSCAVLAPVSKKTTRISRVEEVSRIIHESVAISTQDRQGPTHIDFPMDLQRKSIEITKIESYAQIGKSVASTGSLGLERLIKEISDAESPLIYFGNGIRNKSSRILAEKLIDKTGIPFITSWSAIDLFAESNKQNIGRVGIYGDRHANILLQKSDLVLALGTRLAIPQIGYDKTDFGRRAKKWVIDIDSTECAKFEGLDWNILNCDAADVMAELLQSTEEWRDRSDWLIECIRIKSALPRKDQLGPAPSDSKTQIHSGDVIEFLNENLSADAIVGTDVGAALLTGHYMYEQSGIRRFFTSQGLGEMGFGLPGAIGAHFAGKSRQVVCLNTDGALMFNLQELQVVEEHHIPLKLFVFNNFGYSMIRISQENLFENRISGSTVESGISFPDFSRVASAFGFNHTLVQNRNDLSGVRALLTSNQAELIEIQMDPEQRYFPRLETKKLSDGTLVSPPLEDLDPKIDLALLENLLGYKAHVNSYKARGL
jgi:acetolactate synthase-1/2/3 large subunit